MRLYIVKEDADSIHTLNGEAQGFFQLAAGTMFLHTQVNNIDNDNNSITFLHGGSTFLVMQSSVAEIESAYRHMDPLGLSSNRDYYRNARHGYTIRGENFLDIVNPPHLF